MFLHLKLASLALYIDYKQQGGVLFLQNRLGRPTRYYSKKQERRVNKFVGAKNVANSGATDFHKGDGKDAYSLFEMKTLTKQQKSHSIKKEWFDKNKQEAFAMGRRFSFVVFDFGDGDDKVAMDVADFKELYEAWKEKYEGED